MNNEYNEYYSYYTKVIETDMVLFYNIASHRSYIGHRFTIIFGRVPLREIASRKKALYIRIQKDRQN